MSNKKSEKIEDRLLPVPLSWLKPSPENNDLYRPVSPDDPEVRALAESIRVRGLLEPLVITQDFFILSGHRRHVACRLAGVETVQCRVKPITSNDQQFLLLLREYNRQRVKSHDEVMREELLAANPQEAYERLVEHRVAKARVRAEAIRIEGKKHRAQITAAKRPMLDAIYQVLEERRDYWPLTDRSIHYALLNIRPLKHASKASSRYSNDKESYHL